MIPYLGHGVYRIGNEHERNSQNRWLSHCPFDCLPHYFKSKTPISWSLPVQSTAVFRPNGNKLLHFSPSYPNNKKLFMKIIPCKYSFLWKSNNFSLNTSQLYLLFSNYDVQEWENIDVLSRNPALNPTYNDIELCKRLYRSWWTSSKAPIISMMRRFQPEEDSTPFDIIRNIITKSSTKASTEPG